MNLNLNILLLEDEQRAGEKLITLINNMAPNSVITWKRSVADGIIFLQNELSPDLIFADIELIDGNSFSIFKKVLPKCPIIFCTAYDTFYIEAFSTNGIGYLLKPYTKEQFIEVWQKYIRLFKEGKSELSKDLVSNIFSFVDEKSKNYKKSFTVKKRDGIFLLSVNDITYFKAQGDYVIATDTSNLKHILSRTLKSVENSISPTQFYRINRSEIINANRIVKFNDYTKNRLVITLESPNATLITSGSRTPGFRSWIENK